MKDISRLLKLSKKFNNKKSINAKLKSDIIEVLQEFENTENLRRNLNKQTLSKSDRSEISKDMEKILKKYVTKIVDDEDKMEIEDIEDKMDIDYEDEKSGGFNLFNEKFSFDKFTYPKEISYGFNSNNQISKSLRDELWKKYCGEKYIANCFCCNKEITHGYYECGYIQSEVYGGKSTIDNLRPICSSCYKSMGKTNMVEFMEKYGYRKSNNLYEYNSKEKMLTKSSIN